MEIDQRSYRRLLWLVVLGVTLFVLLQHLGTVFTALGTVLGCLAPIIAGLAIAFILNVPMRGLEELLHGIRASKLRRAVALTVTLLLTLGLLLLIFVVAYSDLRTTAETLLTKLPAMFNDAQKWLENTLNTLTMGELELPTVKIDWDSAVQNITGFLSRGSSDLFSTAAGLTSTVIGTVYNVLFSIIVSIYVLADKERIGRFVRRSLQAFIKPTAYSVIDHIAQLCYVSFSNFIGGQLTDAAILALLCFIGMLIFRFPYALVVSMVIFLGALVPVVGAIAAGAFGSLLILTESPLKAILFLLFLIILQQLEGNLIYPRIVGRSVGLPGIIVLCSVLVGGDLFGIVGAITAVPVSAVIYVLLKEMIDLREAARSAS